YRDAREINGGVCGHALERAARPQLSNPSTRQPNPQRWKAVRKYRSHSRVFLIRRELCHCSTTPTKKPIPRTATTVLFLLLSVWRWPSWLPAQFSRQHPSVVESTSAKSQPPAFKACRIINGKWKEASMSVAEVSGYVAAVLVFMTFYMKTMIPLRIVGICSNCAFIMYGCLDGLYPVLILHLILLPLNSLRLREMLKLTKQARGNEWRPQHGLDKAVHIDTTRAT